MNIKLNHFLEFEDFWNAFDIYGILVWHILLTLITTKAILRKICLITVMYELDSSITLARIKGILAET